MAEIQHIAQQIRQQRQQAERQAAAGRKPGKTARAIQLKALAADAARVWKNIDTQLNRGVASGYDQALQLTLALAEAMQHVERHAEFQHALNQLLTVHGKRRAWMARLEKPSCWRAEFMPISCARCKTRLTPATHFVVACWLHTPVPDTCCDLVVWPGGVLTL